MRTAPDYIQFYPTLRCNRSCDFCFNRGLQKRDDMAFPEFRSMVDLLRKLGVRTLDVIGGEPTLHADLMRFIRYSSQQGVGIVLSSNGTDTLQLRAILEKHPEVRAGVSVNDRKTALLLEAFIRTRRVVVKTVVGSTMDAALINTLLSFQPRNCYLIYRDAMDRKELDQTVPFDTFLRTVKARFGPGQVGTVHCSGFLPDFREYPELLKARCPAGTTKLGIMPDGSVYPCNLFFGFEEFRLGNVLTDPFERIWRHPQLSFFRTFGGNRCPRTDCELHASCHGGCPAHSYAHHGKRSAPEPRCVRE